MSIPDKGFIIKLIINEILYYNTRKSLPKPAPNEISLIEDLRREISMLPDIVPQTNAEAEHIWINFRLRLREHILRDDPRNFLSWDVVLNTMFVDNDYYINQELKSLMASRDWETKWGKAIHEDMIGLPKKYIQYKMSSGNLIHHAYHFLLLEEHTGLTMEDLGFILEFGGGYGSMCRLAYKLGFHGKYIIYDLPEVSALQKYFLKSLSLKVFSSIDEMNNDRSSGVYCTCSDINSLLEIDSTKAQKCLFISTWSLSETEMDFRKTFLSLPLIDTLKNYLITYSDAFGGVDNIKFFRDWSSNKGNINWNHFEIPHLQGNYYLVGKEG